MKGRGQRLVAALTLGLAVVGTPTVASAQSAVAPDSAADASRIAAARADFDRGVEAARAERWGEALIAFRRAYDATHVAHVLLNIGGALIASGRLLDGAEAYRQYLREAPANEAELRANTETALAALEQRIPHARVALTHLAPDDEVAIDGAAISHASIASPLTLDPGRHVLVVSREHHEIVRHRFELIERREESIALDLPEQRTAAARPSVARSPWFIAGMSVLAAGVVAGVAVGVWWAATPPPPGFVGNIEPGWTTAP